MAVFRIEKTRDYTVMANHHLRNTKLSLKAKGLLSLMLSLPEDWDYTTKGLAKICKDGVDSICSTVNELEEHGYVIRERIRNAKGQLTDIQYTILEQPKPPQPGQGKPKQENPVLDSPVLGTPKQEEPEQGNPAQLLIYQIRRYQILSNQIRMRMSCRRRMGWERIRGLPERFIGRSSWKISSTAIWSKITRSTESGLTNWWS